MKKQPPLLSENSTHNVRFRPDIEGLRAIAILLVVGYHADIPGFDGGYIGVDVFFVLSGYLITWLLVQEAEKSGSIDLIKFYSRRARRLLPALFLMLAITIPIGASIYAPFEQRVFANSAITTAAYFSNIYFAKEATDYLGADAETNPYLHTWSLSVEEQFYFFWPVFVMFALGATRWQRKKQSRRRLLYWMCAVAGISFMSSVILVGNYQPWAFFMSPARAWEFAIGAIAVLLPQKRYYEGSLPLASIMSLLGGIGILVAVIIYDKTTSFPGTAACLPVFSTAFLLRAGASDIHKGVAKFLEIRPLQEIGRLSYSWYLWHWPVLVFASNIKSGLPLSAKVGLLFFSLLIAEASYRFIEKPIRYSSLLAQKAAYSLVFAALITILGVAGSYSWRICTKKWEKLPEQLVFTEARYDLPSIYDSGCFAKYPDTEINIDACIGGVPNGTRTMVLFGDSHAANWFPALEQMALTERWRLITLVKAACPPIDMPVIDKNLGREYTECSEWRQAAFKEIQELKPDLVITTASSGYPFSIEDYSHGLGLTLRSLSETSKQVVFFKDTPQLKFRALDYLARKNWVSTIFSLESYDEIIKVGKSEKIFVAQEQLAENFGNVQVVDMNDLIFPRKSCEEENLVRDGVFVYWDSSHLTATFTKSIGADVSRRLNEIIDIDQGR